jgi:hypothetical protein
MAATAGHRLTLDPMGKCSNAFFSETTNQTESKLDRDVHWMVLYKLEFLFRYELLNGGYGRTFNIGPYGKNVSKRFFSETTWTIETKLRPGMIIGRSSTKILFFMWIGNPRWLPPQDID